MNIKLELITNALSDAIGSIIENMDIDVDNMVNSTACNALTEIKRVIQNEQIEDDFDIVEEIVCIFEKYGIDTGERHDFV